MATLVLGSVGGAVGGPPGAGIGALVGSFIDNSLLFPLLFPRKSITPQGLDGLYLSSGNEGAAMNWSLGPRNRVGGTFIHVFELEKIEHKHNVGKGGGGGSTSSFEYFVSFAVAFGEADPQTVSRLRELIGDVKKIYQDGVIKGADNVTLYDGSQTVPDPFLESKLGVGQVPTYRRQVYAVVERLFLGDFGNRVPNIQGVLEQASDVALQDAIATALLRAGFIASDFDVQGVRPCIRGVTFSGVVSTTNVLETMNGIFAVSLQEVDSQLVFRSRGTELVQDIATGDLLDGLRFRETSQNNLPDEVVLDFVSDDLDLQPGVARFRDLAQGGGVQNPVRVTSPFTHSSAEADEIARMHYVALRGESRGVELSLPPSYLHLAAGDVVRVTLADSEEYVIYLDRVELTTAGRVACQGRHTNQEFYTQFGIGDDSAYSGDTGGIPTLRSWIGDLPALVDAAAQDIVVYWGSQAETGSFRQATLVVGNDPVGSVTSQAVMGTTLRGPPAPSSLLTFDESGVVEVELHNNAVLSSSTDSEVALGQANILAIQAATGEWEILGFVDVTPLGDGRFLLSRLLRGLRGTEIHADDHLLSGARVIVLSAGGGRVGAWVAGTTYLNTPVSVRFVPAGASPDSVDPEQFLYRGRTLTPFAPTLPQWWWQAQSPGVWDVELRWRRRTKRFFDPLDANAPLGIDEPGTFRVRIVRAGMESALVREVEVSEEAFTYTQAMRDDDVTGGLLPSSSHGFGVIVQQLSTTVGSGYPLWFTVGANV